MANPDFLTAAQLAKLAKKAGMKPDTALGWEARARQRRWHELGKGVCRIVRGKPAYHVSVLSGKMRRLVKRSNPDMEAAKGQRVLDMQAARQAILAAMDARAMKAGRSWRETALEFVAAVETAAKSRCSPQMRQIKEFDLPYTILREAKEWTAKGKPWTVSRATLYQWQKDAAGAQPISPKSTGAAGSVEKGFRAASDFIWNSPDTVLDLLIAMDEARFVDILRRRGYHVERVQSGPVQCQS